LQKSLDQLGIDDLAEFNRARKGSQRVGPSEVTQHRPIESTRNQTSGRGFNPLTIGAKPIPARCMAHEKLLRLLNILWLLLVFPVGVALSVGFVSHSATLGIKTFLLIEFGIAILSPLLSAILGSRDPSHRNRGK
jgi:hypothetical protein